MVKRTELDSLWREKAARMREVVEKMLGAGAKAETNQAYEREGSILRTRPSGARVSNSAGREGLERSASHVGKGLTVTGRLDTAGAIHIDGRFIGDLTAKHLTVGCEGYVEGDVVADDVRIAGRVKGNVYARNVVLDNTASIAGRIFHNTATVAKGAHVDGRMPWRPPAYFETLENLREAQ